VGSNPVGDLADPDNEGHGGWTISGIRQNVSDWLRAEEPDVVMEQAFHRIADLLQTDPDDATAENPLMPLAYDIDHDTELGRHLARGLAKKLPKSLDDVHEIAIALVFNDLPIFEEQGYPRDKTLRLLIETVIASLTYEMATQDFCDLIIEQFVSEHENAPSDALVAVAAAAGAYYAKAETSMVLPLDAEKHFENVMVRESLRHGTPGQKNWQGLAPANDTATEKIPEYLARLRPQIDEFFDLIGLEDPLGRAVSVAKAAGRLVAVIALEDIGHIHPSIAKSLAKTGMILGSRYRESADA
jgi:hypothetical protein